MSIKSMNWALYKVRANPTLKVILMALADPADPDGVCHPSQIRIARTACCDVRTVKRYIAFLVSEGAIEVLAEKAGKHRTRNKYRLIQNRSWKFTDDLFEFDSESGEFLPVETVQDVRLGNGEKYEETDNGNLFKVSSPLDMDGGTMSPTNSGTGQDAPFKGDTAMSSKSSTSKQININKSRTPFALDHDWQPRGFLFERIYFEQRIPKEFCKHCLLYFVLNHEGSVNTQQAWETKLARWIRQDFHSAITESTSEPRAMSLEWMPAQVAIDAIERKFGSQDLTDAIESFRIYWVERAVTRQAWNSYFIRHVEFIHAQKTRLKKQKSHFKKSARTELTDGEVGEAVRDRLTELNDRSWSQ